VHAIDQLALPIACVVPVPPRPDNSWRILVTLCATMRP